MQGRFSGHRSLLAVTLVSLTLAVWCECSVSAQLVNEHPAFRADARRTGRSIYEGTDRAYVSWRVQTGNYVTSSPAIAWNGTIYIGSFDSRLYSIGHSGRVNWSYRTNGVVSSSPAIGSDGTIYVGSSDGYLYALNPDGSRKWDLRTGQSTGGPIAAVYSSPVLKNGVLYFADEAGRVYSVNPATGSVNWSYAMPAHTYSSPAVGDDGRVYVGCSDGGVYALNPGGSLAWVFRGEGQISATPAIGDDGTVYVGSTAGWMYAVYPNGNRRWAYPTSTKSIGSSAAIGRDGTIYFGSYDGALHAVRPDGTRKWVFPVQSPISCSPLVDINDSIYFGAHNGYLYSLDPNGTVRWSQNLGSKIHSSPAIGSAGAVYVGSYDNYVYAVGPCPEPSSMLQLGALCVSGGIALRRYRRKREGSRS